MMQKGTPPGRWLWYQCPACCQQPQGHILNDSSSPQTLVHQLGFKIEVLDIAAVNTQIVEPGGKT